MDPPLERVDDYFWMRDDKRESKVGACVISDLAVFFYEDLSALFGAVC